uniref:Uncharacterized protein n=1 Tax=Panagrolaimus sp. PS1159 TaxID=55785 RepID=A0AC35GSA3_9BILA
MVFHVGIDPFFGYVSYCNEFEKKIGYIKINKVHSDEIVKVALMFEEIKSKLNGELGYACICFYGYYGLLKARITAGNSELTHLETTYFLSQRFTLEIGNDVITSFEETQQLPIYFTTTIIKNSKNDTLKIHTDRSDDGTSFELPEYSPIFLTFTIDQNEIFSVSFDMSKAVQTLSSYSIPKVEAPFNIEKNAIGIDLGTSR